MREEILLDAQKTQEWLNLWVYDERNIEFIADFVDSWQGNKDIFQQISNNLPEYDDFQEGEEVVQQKLTSIREEIESFIWWETAKEVAFDLPKSFLISLVPEPLFDDIQNLRNYVDENGYADSASIVKEKFIKLIKTPDFQKGVAARVIDNVIGVPVITAGSTLLGMANMVKKHPVASSLLGYVTWGIKNAFALSKKRGVISPQSEINGVMVTRDWLSLLLGNAELAEKDAVLVAGLESNGAVISCNENTCTSFQRTMNGGATTITITPNNPEYCLGINATEASFYPIGEGDDVCSLYVVPTSEILAPTTEVPITSETLVSTTEVPITSETLVSTTEVPITSETLVSTTEAPITSETLVSTTEVPITSETLVSTTEVPITSETLVSTTEAPITSETLVSTTEVPITSETLVSTTEVPITSETLVSTTEVPITSETLVSTMEVPITSETLVSTTEAPITSETLVSTTEVPITSETLVSTTEAPITSETLVSTTEVPITSETLVSTTEAPITSETLVSTTEVPITSETLVSTTEAPITSETLVSTTEVPITSETLVSTTEVPITSETLVSTTEVPITSETLVSTTEVPITSETLVSTTEVPITSETLVSTTEAPITSETLVSTTEVPITSETLVSTTSESSSLTNSVAGDNSDTSFSTSSTQIYNSASVTSNTGTGTNDNYNITPTAPNLTNNTVGEEGIVEGPIVVPMDVGLPWWAWGIGGLMVGTTIYATAGTVYTYSKRNNPNFRGWGFADTIFSPIDWLAEKCCGPDAYAIGLMDDIQKNNKYGEIEPIDEFIKYYNPLFITPNDFGGGYDFYYKNPKNLKERIDDKDRDEKILNMIVSYIKTNPDEIKGNMMRVDYYKTPEEETEIETSISAILSERTAIITKHSAQEKITNAYLAIESDLRERFAEEEFNNKKSKALNVCYIFQQASLEYLVKKPFLIEKVLKTLPELIEIVIEDDFDFKEDVLTNVIDEYIKNIKKHSKDKDKISYKSYVLKEFLQNMRIDDDASLSFSLDHSSLENDQYLQDFIDDLDDHSKAKNKFTKKPRGWLPEESVGELWRYYKNDVSLDEFNHETMNLKYLDLMVKNAVRKNKGRGGLKEDGNFMSAFMALCERYCEGERYAGYNSKNIRNTIINSGYLLSLDDLNYEGVNLELLAFATRGQLDLCKSRNLEPLESSKIEEAITFLCDRVWNGEEEDWNIYKSSKIVKKIADDYRYLVVEKTSSERSTTDSFTYSEGQAISSGSYKSSELVDQMKNKGKELNDKSGSFEVITANDDTLNSLSDDVKESKSGAKELLRRGSESLSYVGKLVRTVTKKDVYERHNNSEDETSIEMENFDANSDASSEKEKQKPTKVRPKVRGGVRRSKKIRKSKEVTLNPDIDNDQDDVKKIDNFTSSSSVDLDKELVKTARNFANKNDSSEEDVKKHKKKNLAKQVSKKIIRTTSKVFTNDGKPTIITNRDSDSSSIEIINDSSEETLSLRTKINNAQNPDNWSIETTTSSSEELSEMSINTKVDRIREESKKNAHKKHKKSLLPNGGSNVGGGDLPPGFSVV